MPNEIQGDNEMPSPYGRLDLLYWRKWWLEQEIQQVEKMLGEGGDSANPDQSQSE